MAKRRPKRAKRRAKRAKGRPKRAKMRRKMAKRSGQEGQEEAQDGQEEAQEGQEEGQEGQDEAQEGQEEAPRGPRGGQRGPRGPAVKKPYFLTPLPRQMANYPWPPRKTTLFFSSIFARPSRGRQRGKEDHGGITPKLAIRRGRGVKNCKRDKAKEQGIWGQGRRKAQGGRNA